MTQRIFDIENEKDMQDLWDIFPDDVTEISYKNNYPNTIYTNRGDYELLYSFLFNINWHNKTKITRPIKEATENDIGKICIFWDNENCYYGILININKYNFKYQMDNESLWKHCRRLTKQEIEELC